MIGWHVEVVSPGVFSAIQAWYCGGPRITRTVIATDLAGNSNSNGTDGISTSGTELELFPLRLVVCTCDERGSTIDHSLLGPQHSAAAATNNNNNNSNNNRYHRKDESWVVREVLVSKAATVGDLLRELVRMDLDHGQSQSSGSNVVQGQGGASAGATASVILPSANANSMLAAADKQTNPLSSSSKANSSGTGAGAVGMLIDISHVRLWNYAPLHWKQQFVLGQAQEQGQGPASYGHSFVDQLTLEAARLQDGQRVLLERRLPDGTWPRQRLQEVFEQQQQQQQQQVDNDAGVAMHAGNSSVDNNYDAARMQKKKNRYTISLRNQLGIK